MISNKRMPYDLILLVMRSSVRTAYFVNNVQLATLVHVLGMLTNKASELKSVFVVRV